MPNDDLTKRRSLGDPTPDDRVIALWDDGSASVVMPRTGTITIGRAEDCALRIDHSSVSRHHATLHFGKPVQLEDLGSANGTLVAGRRLEPHQRCDLLPETLVRIGDALIVLRLAAAETKKVTAAPNAEPMQGTLARFVALAAGCTLPVVVLGETGVGKGVLAQAIHAASSRARAPLVRLNCAALPEALLESELFGHERGAFTGAVQAKPGLLESANGGTFLLDEVGELPPATQAKLLHVLEHGEVLRVGSLRPRSIDVRFIAATNRDLEALLATGRFRRDLYFRLAGLTVTIPPLRERRSEIPTMARALLEDACVRMSRPPPVLSDEAVQVLSLHAWPGNVRELKNAMARVALLVGPVVNASDVVLSDIDAIAPEPSAPKAEPTQSTSTDRIDQMRRDMRDLDRQRIVDALARCGGSQTKAAKDLGISRRTLTKRLSEYSLPRPRKD